MYHSIGNQSEYGNVSKERFESDLEFLTEHYEVADIPTVAEASDDNSKQVALTVDDGFKNFFTNALPLLKEFEVPATVFVVSGEVTGHKTNLNANATLNSEQICQLVQEDLITIGNHTKTHPNLSKVTGERLREEIIAAQQYLESKFGITVDQFCYPSGDVSNEALSVVRESHAYATTTQPALVTGDMEPHLLPRIDAYQPLNQVRWELTDLSAGLRKAAERMGLVESNTIVSNSKA